MKSVVHGVRVGLLFSALATTLHPLAAAEVGDPSRVYEGVAPASDEGERAIKGFQIPEGLAVELVAAEPHLANAVAFSIDEQGRFYVVEGFRHGSGILDIRGRRGWPKQHYRESLPPERLQNLADEVLDTDLASGTVDDRIAYLKNYFGNGAASLAGASDRIRLLWDSDGDGVVDRDTLFADGFSRAEDGLASGVLAWRGDVYFTNIPDLWRLRDTDGDGVADERQSLSHGYGVRSGFLGHDMHGLEFGPDGRLYFTIGDRSASVALPGGHFVTETDSGVVFRCNPDGSGLEIFASGLRNPQELTFDQHGNLFTGDNNSDGGDQARWVHLVEGGDSGWRIGYQFLERSDAIYHDMARGPWNAEKMWHEQNEEQPAFLVPPVAIIGNGPSGVTFYPGTGLTEMWNGRFFMVDFKGQANISGVHAFELQANGAGFKIGHREQFIWNVLATDAEFGVDGGLYVLDWVQGWNRTGKGRIYRVFDPALEEDELIAETRELLHRGMRNRSTRELARHIGHQDYRIRLDAQFELVRRGEDGLRTLSRAARQNHTHVARLHGVWGIGQILREFQGQVRNFSVRQDALDALLGLLDDENEQVRAQAASVLGDARAQEAFEGLVQLTADESAPVRRNAVMALGKLRRIEAVPSILQVVRANQDADPLLRHAGVMALTWLGDVATLRAAANDASPAVRMASLLAMRRLKRDEVEQFLSDEDPRIVREAARAINDGQIDGATLALAEHEAGDWNDFVISSRVVNANLRAGTMAHARRLAQLAANADLPAPLREDSLLALAGWADPSGRDRVTGVWRPLIASSRDGHVPAEALKPEITNVLTQGPQKVQLAAIRAATSLGLVEAGTPLGRMVGDETAAVDVRVAALEALASLQAGQLEASLTVALASSQEKLRNSAAAIRARGGGSDSLALIEATLKSGSITAKQQALASLADVSSPSADQLVLGLVKDLEKGAIPAELALDVLEAAAAREGAPFQEAIERLGARGEGSLAPFWTALAGGDVEAGRKIFHEREDVACLRCHQVGGLGGEVGPKMDGLASRVSAEHILEAIVLPNAKIAEGFENVLIETKDGVWVAGMIKSDTAEELVINSPEDGMVTIAKADIKNRERGASGMPAGMDQILSRRELRDLMAYLYTLK